MHYAERSDVSSVATRAGQTGLYRLIGRVDTFLEANFWACAVIFTGLLLAARIAQDAHTKLLADELYTLYVARLPTVKDVIALNNASPPFYPIVVHSLLPIIHGDAIAARLAAPCSSACCCFAAAGSRHSMPSVFRCWRSTHAARTH